MEENKSSIRKPTDFWYKAGGYKGNIVPYSISKIITSIPEGYTLDWERIWRNQSISPAFMAEVERITKLTNDYICDSHTVKRNPHGIISEIIINMICQLIS